MCIADIAAGRRTLVQSRTQVVTLAASYTLPADPRRIRLTVVAPNNAGVLALSAGDVVGSPFATIAGSNGFYSRPYLIEEYGSLLMGAITFTALVFDANNVHINEILADFILDKVIQEEV